MVLSAAIQDKVSSILVLEDDACLVPDFPRLAGAFLAKVPADWDCLMLGGQHLTPPTPLCPGVVHCTATNRTHAYAMRPRMMNHLLQLWHYNPSHHCDIIMAAIMRTFKAYAPDPFLIGQDVGYSDITETYESLRFLNTGAAEITRYNMENGSVP